MAEEKVSSNSQILFIFIIDVLQKPIFPFKKGPRIGREPFY
ncbi:hypothetical protein CTL2C_56 [Chlamydia trachomatis L2c]|nr:hypothetical protein CTL2C_56 [Chlamydia trachomatis L2c]